MSDILNADQHWLDQYFSLGGPEKETLYMGEFQDLLPENLLAILMIRSDISSGQNFKLVRPNPSPSMIQNIAAEYRTSERQAADIFTVGTSEQHNRASHESTLVSLTNIRPQAPNETSRMRMKSTDIQSGEITFSEYNSILNSLLAPEIRRLIKKNKPIFILSPLTVVTYQFLCKKYGSKNYPLSGTYYHTTAKWIGPANIRYERGEPVIRNSVHTTRLWSDASRAMLEVDKTEEAYRLLLARYIAASNLSTPYEGGLPS